MLGSRWWMLLLALARVATALSNGDSICTEGYIMDYLCINRGTLLDRSDVVTLERPDLHSVYCLVDVSSCVRSGYAVLLDPGPNESLYTVGYATDSAGTNLLASVAREVGRGNGCTTCTNGGFLEEGFRAGILGTVIDAAADPPLIQINSAVYVDPATMFCASQVAVEPTSVPISTPTSTPTSMLTTQPTLQPSMKPTGIPTNSPTSMPTTFPTQQTPVEPSSGPTNKPSQAPITLLRTSAPTASVSANPSANLSEAPSANVTASPSSQGETPSPQQSEQPSETPSMEPTSLAPTTLAPPTGAPTEPLTGMPTTRIPTTTSSSVNSGGNTGTLESDNLARSGVPHVSLSWTMCCALVLQAALFFLCC